MMSAPENPDGPLLSKYVWLPSWGVLPRHMIERGALELRLWPFGARVQVGRWVATVRLWVLR